MALEGLAALSLASNIVQFVDFGCRLFSETKELYTSSNGLALEAMELENISQTLGRLSKDLESNYSLGGPSSSGPGMGEILRLEPANSFTTPNEESDLILIAQECQKIAKELSTALEQLKVKGPGRQWQCSRVTLKRIWKPEMVEKIARRMERFSSQLTMCLIRILQ